jgi:transposase
VCFLDGHVRAFEYFGAAPHRAAYDNLKPAVARVLVGSERELAVRFTALTTHYLLEASFARPRTGHDKGGVEARGKTIRWQELVPIPSGPDLRTVSAALLDDCVD